MAASLKNPSHFMKPLSEYNAASGEPAYNLLRPAALTVSSKMAPEVTDASAELMNARQQIEKLKLENESLKKDKSNSLATPNAHDKETHVTHSAIIHPRTHSSSTAPAPLHEPVPLPVPDPRHLLELQRQTEMIISRQAADIARLKAELSTQEAQHTAELARIKVHGKKARTGLEERVLRLTKDLKETEDQYRRREQESSEAHQRDVAHLNEEVKKSTQSLQRVREESERRVAELSNRLVEGDKAHKVRADLLENDLRDKEAQVSRLNSQVAQLKAYIGDALPSNRTAAQWDVEKKTNNRKIETLEREQETSQETINMLNVRLNSLNEIMTIQEAEMAKCQDGGSQQKGNVLLTIWREQVFALLVQRKSLEIVAKRDNTNHMEKLKAVQSQLEGTGNKVRMLEHALADRQAQLELEKKNVQRVQQELVSVQEVAGMLDKKLQETESCLCRIKTAVTGHHKLARGIELRHQEAAMQLSSHEQRLSFAVSRIELCQDLLSRRDVMIRLKQGAAGEEVWCDNGTQTDPSQLDLVHQLKLNAEIERLKLERDSLASRLKEDSAVVQQRVTDIKREMTDKVQEYEDRIVQLGSELEKQRQTVECAEEEVGRKVQSLTEARDEVIKIKTDLAKTQLVAEGASDEKCRLLEEKHTQRLAEMEKRLNEARREQAKAVVSLRQLERRSSRERERSAEALSSQEDYLTRETSRLRARLNELEADRNLLMATLRQEGLIGSFKARQTVNKSPLPESEQRGVRSPQLEHDEDASPATEKCGDHSAAATKTDGHSTSKLSMNQGREPLQAVLKDLQAIASRVLEDDDEEDDEEGWET